jgi:circadian clock protein KaiC
VPALDDMLGGQGYYRGSSILVSGTAGSGKTSLAAHFANAVCGGGERCLYLAFEESPSQLMRNMRSIGVNLERFRQDGSLKLQASRPTLMGLEAHLVQIHKAVLDFEPSAVVVDPVSNFMSSGSSLDAAAMLLRLIDFLKSKQITALFTHLTPGGVAIEATDVGVSSLIDTWLLVRDMEAGGERNRGLYVIKSRGMSHSNQVREFLITSSGIALQDVYVGSEGVLTGSMRAAQEAREIAAEVAHREELELRERELERKRAATAAQIEALQLDLQSIEAEAALVVAQGAARESTLMENRAAMAKRRGNSDPKPAHPRIKHK